MDLFIRKYNLSTVILSFQTFFLTSVGVTDALRTASVFHDAANQALKLKISLYVQSLELCTKHIFPQVQ